MATNIPQEEIDEAMRLLKLTHQILSEVIRGPLNALFDDPEPDRARTYVEMEEEASLRTVLETIWSVREAIDRLTSVAIEPELPP